MDETLLPAPQPRSPEQLAQHIASVVFNQSEPVLLTRSNLKEAAGKTKFREGYIKPVLDMLSSAGYGVTRLDGGSIKVSPPEERAVPYEIALERSKEAQEAGCRPIPGGHSSDVMLDPLNPR